MTFVKTEDGNYINIAGVKEAIVETDFLTLRLKSGATRRAGRASWFQSFSHRSRSAFPAQPGTYCLSVSRNGDRFDVFQEPVIGWAIGESDDVFAVMACRARALDHTFAVLHPDGRVQDSFTRYEGYDDWYKDMVRIHFEPELRDAKAGKLKVQ